MVAQLAAETKARMQQELEKSAKDTAWDIPGIQRRAVAKSLDVYGDAFGDAPVACRRHTQRVIGACSRSPMLLACISPQRVDR